MACENLPPQVVSRLMSEIRDLSRHPPDGISYLDNDDSSSITEIHALITGPDDTPFAGGKFRMKLVLSADFPASPPRGFFLTKIYHPNIASNGSICVNTLKRDWTPDVPLKHVLQVIRCLLIVPFPESSLNDEAGKLFMDSYDEFARRARIMTQVHAMEEVPGDNTSSLKVASGDSEPVASANSVNTKKKADDKKKKGLKRL